MSVHSPLTLRKLHLYNGRNPPEIRETKYAMTEYIKTEPEAQYEVMSHYARPGYTGHRATCRRVVYLETYHLPPTTKEHVFWHGRGPFPAEFCQLVCRGHGGDRAEQELRFMCPEYMEGIEKQITVLSSDW
ncbi:hypothetical protein M430DRAFT_19659 [Amorphotheca resinae ATCC 22711]|jgi:hypothetical protein|uniref:Uncharacterized protein n=1 Tax=Amorphotheca resinae ATCC 22711 TaxID=857342 RepID=A0A2T3AZW1_AMORE|nr:hypothetical protein M430DRAFT_19659 [Amorphotheca resinae ATCC 22711]PSS16684.1 hypothetical protein M430DRAFT_19659 [Amorphotheca resinae ATCC 22711]